MKPETLRMDERASITLRALYQQYGYLPYQVNTFEEYDLYMKNRSMLSSEQILTFAGAGGQLMALKPDITLSIVKNTKDEDTPVKVCYAERIYRVPHGSQGFKEIMQTGIESIGEIDDYAMGEVLLLAARSLEAISPDYMLDVSDMGFVSALLSPAKLTPAQRAQLLSLISEKNLHGLLDACRQMALEEDTTQLLSSLVTLYGPMEKTLSAYEAMTLPPGCKERLAALRVLCDMLLAQGASRINLDFSVVNDMNYYNGLIFSGFISGIPTSVLSGGRYDLLMRRMGRSSGAIGFAVYLDQIERLGEKKEAFDVDMLILTDEHTDPLKAAKTAASYIDQGMTVRVQRACGTAIRAAHTLDLTQKGVQQG